MRKTLAVVALLLALAGCTPAAAYVEADRATFDVIAPAHTDYVNSDPTLDDDQRARRLRLLDSWRIRIEQAEGGGS